MGMNTDIITNDYKVPNKVLGKILATLNHMTDEKQFFYPDKNKVFDPFSQRIIDIKLVVLGGEPLPLKSHTSIPFASQENNISGATSKFIECLAQCGEPVTEKTFDTSLSVPISQGVLFLNCALTAPKQGILSHRKIWSEFIDCVLKALSNYKDIAFLLLGPLAKEKEYLIDKTHNYVGKTSHPSSFLHGHDMDFNVVNDALEYIYNTHGTSILWKKQEYYVPKEQE